MWFHDIITELHRKIFVLLFKFLVCSSGSTNPSFALSDSKIEDEQQAIQCANFRACLVCAQTLSQGNKENKNYSLFDDDKMKFLNTMDGLCFVSRD